jgi:predicted ATPase/class 3 adenylate cyclase
MAELPRGTVTFLFTDIEGSTALWERDRNAMAAAVERHIALLDSAIQDHGGIHFKTIGDAVQAAFPTAPAAVAAALDAQRALLAGEWGEVGPLWVRMALHAGDAQPDQRGDYLAAPLNRLSRLLASGHGGQILLSLTVQQLARGTLPSGSELRDLGEHRLRDLLEPERVFQLLHPELPAEFPPLKSLENRPNNLPRQPTPFLGREREVGDVVGLLSKDQLQLLTLVGPGGTGKTRLALQAAADLLDDFADGVFFVPLASVTDPTLVPSVIATALGVHEQGAQPLGERLREFLATKQLLLVLDNLEHLVETAQDIGRLLDAAPGLKVLATSRVPLRLRAEREYPVPPLALPRREPPPTLEQVSKYEAVRLFIERAQAVKPDFAINNDNARAVAEICHRLDGLPLAIELAAARVRMLPPEAMLSRLEQRLPFLTGGARDAPARQRTLRDTIAWSYDLLDPDEQTLFRRLAVFAGGCTLEAVEAVEAVINHDSTLDVFAGVERLGEQSLLRQDAGSGGESRYVMLETIREYGLEQLAASGEEGAVRDAHAAHFAALGDDAERAWILRPGPFIATLEAGADNLRAAMAWAESRGATDIGLRLGLAFSMLVEQRGMFGEGRGWWRRLLALPGGDPSLRARSLTLLGWLAQHQGDADAVADPAEQAVDLAREEGWVRAYALNLLGIVELSRESPDAARRYFEEALNLLRADPSGEVFVPELLMHLGLVAADQGDLVEARRSYEAALASLPAGGAPSVRAIVLDNLAWVDWEEGDRHRAAVRDREALGLHGELREMHRLVGSFEVAAEHAADAGRAEAAACLLGAAEALRTRIGVTIEPGNLKWHHSLMTSTREQLGETAFKAAWSQGEGLTLEDAIAAADAVLAEAERAGAGTTIGE